MSDNNYIAIPSVDFANVDDPVLSVAQVRMTYASTLLLCLIRKEFRPFEVVDARWTANGSEAIVSFQHSDESTPQLYRVKVEAIDKKNHEKA